MASARAAAVAHKLTTKVFPPRSTHSSTLLFLHGLGDTAEGGWSDVAPLFQQRIPGLKVVLPNAPMGPVRRNGGMVMQRWWDVKTIESKDTADFRDLPESNAAIQQLIDAEVASGIPSHRIVLGGFSQGGGLSLYAGLRSEQRLGGIVCLSGRLPGGDEFGSLIGEANKRTPVLMLHGDSDQVVTLPMARDSYELLAKARPHNLEWKVYKGMGHHAEDEELGDVVAFLQKVLKD